MKQFILPWMVVVCFLAACNNSKTGVKDEKQTLTAEATKPTKVTAEMKQHTEELQKLTALNLDSLKTLLPEQLMGSKRTSLQAHPSAGTSVAVAEYSLNDSTRVEVTISDCGGAAGAGLYGQQYLNLIDSESEAADGYTRTIDFRGKAIESCNNKTNRCTLTYFTGNRYLVVLEGKNMHPNGLKQAAMELNL